MPATAVPHLIDAPTRPRPRALPEGWLRGLVAGLEAAALSWLTVVVPVVATYVATAAAPVLGEASWQGAARTGSALWLLGLGADLTVAPGVRVSLVPLGLSLLTVALLGLTTARMRLGSYTAAAFAVPGFVLGAAVAGTLAGTPVAWAGLLTGAVVVALLGTGWGMRRAPAPAPPWWEGLRSRTPEPLRAGLAAAARASLALTVLVAGVLAVAVVGGWDRIGALHAAYATGVVGTVVLVLAQALYLPTGAVWALAWVAGPGFAVGAQTLVTAGEVRTAPLPAIPLLGALPTPGAHTTGWVLALPVVAGMAAGVWLHLRRPAPTLPGAALGALSAAVAVALGAALVTAAAAGSIGPGRMAVVGADPTAVGLFLLAEVALGALLVVLTAHPRTREAARTGARALGQRGARRRGPEEVRDEPTGAAGGPDDRSGAKRPAPRPWWPRRRRRSAAPPDPADGAVPAGDQAVTRAASPGWVGPRLSQWAVSPPEPH